jgi:hypothetical protein
VRVAVDEAGDLNAAGNLVALHGFVSLEAAGGFGLPQSVDVSPLLSIHRAAR